MKLFCILGFHKWAGCFQWSSKDPYKHKICKFCGVQQDIKLPFVTARGTYIDIRTPYGRRV